MRAKTSQFGRKKTIIGIVILGLILFAIILIKAPDGAEHAVPDTGESPAEPVDNSIFTAQNFESIMMYGSPRLWDDEKNLSVDLNNDGVSEEFVISKDFSDNIILKGIQRDAQGETTKSINFWTEDISALLPAVSKEGNSISEGYYLQISSCDIDEDGIKEVLVSVGDRARINVTAIYEYSATNETPFKYRGRITCETVVKYIGSGTIYAFRGQASDNPYDVYVYNGKELCKK